MEVERVQSVSSVSKTLNTIPSEFIQSEHEQPGLTTYNGPVPEVPIIDLSGSDGQADRVIHQIVEASKEWGIFQVVNHGIPAEVIKELQRVGKEFFELPIKEKEKIAMEPGSNEGYGTKLHSHGKKMWVDFLFHNIWPLGRVNHDKWPHHPAEYKNANEEYRKYMVPLVDQIMEYLSIGLGLDKSVLKEASGGDELRLLLKINFYPPCPRPDLTLGVAPHTDMSAITLLVPNEVQGLQVCKDDRWFEAKYVPNAMIVHIGDQVEILSNGKYKSVFHRTTVNKEKTRMSWPVFCEPPEEHVVGPLPQLVNEENPAKFKTKKYKDYQYCKLNKIPQ